MQNNIREIVQFSLDEPRYAVAASEVIRVVRAVEITPLPMAPEIVMGVIDFHGEILPVIDIRKLFRLPSRDLRLEDQFIIVQIAHRRAVIVVDSVIGVHLLEQHQSMEVHETSPFSEYLSGIVSIQQSIILINDPDAFLSVEENQVLDQALSGVGHDG